MGGEFATSICDTIADAECGGRWSCCRAHARGYGAQTENGRRAAGRREEIIPYMNAFVRACDCAIRSAGRIDSDAGRSPFFLPIDNKEGTPRKQSCGLWPGPRVSSGLGYTTLDTLHYSRPWKPVSKIKWKSKFWGENMACAATRTRPPENKKGHLVDTCAHLATGVYRRRRCPRATAYAAAASSRQCPRY